MTRLEFLKTVGYEPTEEEREFLMKLDTGLMKKLYVYVARGNSKLSRSELLHYLIMYDMFYGERSVEADR